MAQRKHKLSTFEIILLILFSTLSVFFVILLIFLIKIQRKYSNN